MVTMPPKRTEPRPPCSVPSCSVTSRYRSWCSGHAERARLNFKATGIWDPGDTPLVHRHIQTYRPVCDAESCSRWAEAGASTCEKHRDHANQVRVKTITNLIPVQNSERVVTVTATVCSYPGCIHPCRLLNVPSLCPRHAERWRAGLLPVDSSSLRYLDYGLSVAS